MTNVKKTIKKTTKKSTKAPAKKDSKKNNEVNRLLEALNNKSIDPDKLNIALGLITNLASMPEKIEKLQKDVKEHGMWEVYQSGVNQKSSKTTAQFNAYIALTKLQASLTKQLTELLPVSDKCAPVIVEKKDDFETFLGIRKNKND